MSMLVVGHARVPAPRSAPPQPPRSSSLLPPPRRSVPGRPFTALVITGQAGVRRTLASRLRALGALEVCEAASIHEARAVARAARPRDLCLLDLALPDGRGLDLLPELRNRGWRRLVVLSPHGETAAVRAAFAAGANGFLLTPHPRAEPGQVDARADLAAGPRELVRVPGVAELSAREIEVLRLVAEGQSNKAVGEALHLSSLTVKSHLARIARKLGTGDRAEMVALTMRGGAIS